METEMDNIMIARRQQRQNWMLVTVLGVTVLGVGALVGAALAARGWSLFGGGGAGGNKVPIYLAADQRVTQQLSLNSGFSAVAKAVTPAVVTINTESRGRQQSPLFVDPFRDFFGPDQDEERSPRRRTPQQPQTPQSPQNRGRLRPSGVGSGVIVSPDGYILTNNHVVEDADKVSVTLNDRRTLTAKVVGTDPPSDVAVLKIDGGGFPTLSLGDSNQVEVGDIVLAVGIPLNIGQTVTMGIISAKSRSTSGAASGSYEDFLQTDAAINRGNSGGALVNLRGELIGIPSQIVASLGGNIGIGFAIPSLMAKNVMDQLIRGGKVRRGMLGVNVSEVTPDLAEQFGYKGTQGALVQVVVPGKPAEQAGVKRGDIITEFQGQRVADSSTLRNLASQTSPGTAVKFKIWRDGAERELTAKLVEVTPDDLAAASPERGGGGGDGEKGSGVLSGISVDNLSPEVAQRLNLPPTTRGVVITEIEPDSNAAAAGLRRGDVIEEVARQPVANVNEFNAALAKVGNKSALLSVRGAQGPRFVVVKPQE
ncbi:MAG TPA: Do family serine endopeptidase [Blastocatellia bacterium]|nr:Do family serine endopeptidase [Blastocatellia bacterium]